MSSCAQTPLGRFFQSSGHHVHYALGADFYSAAQSLAADWPLAARACCAWSRHFFVLYNEAWTAHLPASRWDSDGGAEIQDADSLAHSLPETGPALPPWLDFFLAGDWQAAAAAPPPDPLPPAFQPLLKILIRLPRPT